MSNPLAPVWRAIETFIVRLDEAEEMVGNCTLADQPYCHQAREALFNLRIATEDLETALGYNE
jgi:hypothetical protein